MNKIINASIAYFASAIAAGVFYREFTKYNGYTGATALGRVHTHLFMLGMIMFLIIALFCRRDDSLPHDKTFKRFFVLYNISLPFMACAMLVRGIMQVQNVDLSKSADAMISGITGIAHILITVSLALLFVSLKKNLSGRADN